MKTLFAAFAGFALAASFSAPAIAAGSDTTSEPAVQCPKGKIWSSSKNRCVKKTSSNLNDDDRFSGAVRLAYAGEYAASLELLNTIKNQHQAKVLNFLGYTNRKLGRIDEGLGFYKKALVVDPNYVLAREYMGEGYLQKGDLASAEAQLAEIGARCGEVCPEYQKLARAVIEYRSTGTFSAKNAY